MVGSRCARAGLAAREEQDEANHAGGHCPQCTQKQVYWRHRESRIAALCCCCRLTVQSHLAAVTVRYARARHVGQ